MKPKTLRWKTLSALAVMACVAVILAAFQQGLLRPGATEAALQPRVQGVVVTAAPVVKDRLRESLTLMGTITADRDVAVVSETQGRITTMHAELGDSLRAGSLLFEVDSEVMHAQLKAAQTNFLKAQKDLDRYEALFARGVVSANEIESTRLAYAAAETQNTLAQRQYRDTFVRSPIEGIVSAMNVEKGTVVQPGMVVANVVDISRLKVRLSVAESDAFRLAAGARVDVVTDVYPGVTFPGTIHAVGHKADELHTYPVEITMKNSVEHPLRAGMFCRASLPVHAGEEVLSIPREALTGSSREPKVFVVQDGHARLRDIVTGSSRGLRIEVRKGLAQGELVIVSGRNLVKDNDVVQVVREGGQ